ncbi:hypothetical protein Pint_32570 [Pistacia integerrima]|uniref:Uncharacterized protein n=1 Tax=Pistacia integerrima TaxID=434235 RepID=A0ACC0XN25_9ROSI|nr:hypothetical protein Pint_32570 [Pistacia integerrima]
MNMETLAVTRPRFPSTLRFSATPSINFKTRISHSRWSLSESSRSLCLRSSGYRFRTLKCTASPSLVDQFSKFQEASRRGNLIPLYRCIFSDHLTPVLAYRCLVKEDDRDAPSFLFESVEPGLLVSSIGRYSVVGAQPTIEIVAKENMVTVMDHEEGKMTEEIVEDPMVVPRRIMEGWKPQLIDELPEAFCGKRIRLINCLVFS